MSTIINLPEEENIHLQPDDMELTCTDSPVSTSPKQSEIAGGAEQQTMRVYLRVRPFSKAELSDNEDQGCVVIENSQMVTLHAPKGSATMKSSEKGIGMSLHKFSFSQIFGPETTQVELYEDTVQSKLSDFLDGRNALIFSYGVTNAGKTFTIQGSPKEPGILPRVLDATFRHTGGRQYEAMDLKPCLRNNVQFLDPDQVKQERSAKAAIFASFKEDGDPPRASGGSESSSCSVSSVSSLHSSYDQTVFSDPVDVGSSHFALWVAFFEIYNECVYDLLQLSLCSKSKRRAALRVCDDGAGNAYVKALSNVPPSESWGWSKQPKSSTNASEGRGGYMDLGAVTSDFIFSVLKLSNTTEEARPRQNEWINVHNMGEACKLLQFGNKNRSAAATKMNHSSSRSHSIFTMKLLRIDGGTVKWISEFSLCDLAGSERCNKTKTFGERLKEAGNINTSLLILGKCITALRNNQTDRMKSSYIPFRESKLTKLFQAVFLGKGKASMIVNINQCASTYDETLHVMKFSAVASQVVQVIPDKTLVSLSPCLVGRDGKPLLRMDSQDLERFLSDDELLEEENEADMSLLPQNEMVNMVESLRTKLLAERRRNLVQEMEIRKEMGDAMLQQLMESEELRSREIEELKESYQEKLENTFEMYKDAIKEHAYQSAMNSLEDDYVPLKEFIAEQEKTAVLRRKLSAMEMLSSDTGVSTVPTVDQSCQTQPSTESGEAEDERFKRLHREKCALERLCEDKQQLILSLEKRLRDLNETLQKVRDGFLKEKALDLEALQRKSTEQTKSMEELRQQNIDMERKMGSLKAEILRLSQKSPIKTKRGLLANIREAVTSPRKNSAGRTLRKTARTPHH